MYSSRLEDYTMEMHADETTTKAYSPKGVAGDTYMPKRAHKPYA
jgi:hypothetical protein